MAMILRSMASAPIGGPAGASGSGTATRAAYHSTAPSTRSRKTAVISAGTLTSPMSLSAELLGGWRDGVGGIGHRARDRLGRPSLHRDPAAGVDLDRKAVHWPRRRPLDDLTVAVVDRPVAWALEAALVGEGLIATVRRAWHGRVLRRPRNGAAQVRALPVQREETLGHTREIELAVAVLLDVADLEVSHVAGHHGAAERTQALGSEEAQKADAPLAEHHHDRAPTHPAEHHAPPDAGLLLDLELVQLAKLTLLLRRDEQPQLARCLSHLSPQSSRAWRGSQGHIKIICWPRKNEPTIVRTTYATTNPVNSAIM